MKKTKRKKNKKTKRSEGAKMLLAPSRLSEEDKKELLKILGDMAVEDLVEKK